MDLKDKGLIKLHYLVLCIEIPLFFPPFLFRDKLTNVFCCSNFKFDCEFPVFPILL